MIRGRQDNEAEREHPDVHIWARTPAIWRRLLHPSYFLDALGPCTPPPLCSKQSTDFTIFKQSQFPELQRPQTEDTKHILSFL